MQLIITEKAIAGQRIASLLSGKEVALRREDDAQVGEFKKDGKEFVVIPLRGHISNVDFPKRYSYWLGTDLKQLTMAPVEYVGTEKAIIALLKKRAKEAVSVIIATDADREGESIGVEALDYLKESNPNLSVQRAYFSAITPKDIETAFSKLGKVDFGFADSANARREVDLIWGAVLTRFVSLMSGRMGKEFLSVGRVQTPSVDYNEDIMIKRPDGIVSLEKIGKFVEENSLDLEREIGSCMVFKAKSGFEALSFNPKTLKTEFKPITHTVKHRFLGNLLQIHLETGRKAKITGSHSVFVVRDSMIKILLGDELKEGDVLLAPKRVITPEITHIDLLSETARLSSEKGKFLLYGAFEKKWVELTASGNAFLRARRAERKFIVHRSRFASVTISQWESGARKIADYQLLRDYLEALGQNADEFVASGFGKVVVPFRKVVRVRDYSSGCLLEPSATIGCSDQKWRLPVKLPITAEFSRLLGYYVAEGSKSKAGCFLDFGSHETGLVSDASECIEKVFGRKPAIKQKNSVLHISFGGRCFSRLIEQVFLVGDNARTKRIPAAVFNFARDKKLEFLKGYFEGDGNYSTSGQLMCSTASEKLASDLVYLLSTLGILATIENGVNVSALPGQKNSEPRQYYKVKVSGKGNLQALKRAVPERHRGRFRKYFYNDITRCGFDGIPIKETGLKDIWIDLPRHYADRIGSEKFSHLIQNTNKRMQAQVIERLRSLANSDLLFLRIKKIDTCKPATDFVFDISVQDNENFVGGTGGIVLHNTLALIVDREKERRAFQSQKYWVVSALFEKDKQQFVAEHRNGKFWEKELAAKILGKKSEYGVVSRVQTKQRVLEKPLPFDTTSFLRASTVLGLTAGEAMNIAETLYQNGFISYPRTDNQVYPATLDLKQILLELQNVPVFKQLSEKILTKPLNPSKGKESKDHPPIHPVSAANPKSLTEKQWRVYELVCRRFFATLAEEAVTLNTSVELLLQNEPFVANGQTILKLGWKEFYPYSTLKEVFLPKLEQGDKAKLLDLKMDEKETQPPARYSQSALIKLMSELGLGTKSTRHETIQKLYARKYISGLKAIEPSNIAFAVIDSLEKHCKKVTEPKMTADLEKEMDEIAVGKITKESVVTGSRTVLLSVLEELLKEKSAIATELHQGLRQDSIMGKCTGPSCGGDLLIRFGKTGKRFLGCSNYPTCTVTYPLPQKGKLAALGTLCEVCHAPKIRLSLVRSSFEMCVNMDCSTKDEWKKRSAELKQKKVAVLAEKESFSKKESVVAGEKTVPVPKKRKKPAVSFSGTKQK
jgi:DNA topoisomerase I